MAQNSELKHLANIAKQRLRNANYNSATKATYNSTKTNNYFVKNIASLKKISANCEFVTINNSEDLMFLKKVFSMLSNNEDIYNPIGRLIDKEYYKTLSDSEKQFYVFNIADRYNKAKEQFYAQQVGKNG